eukprot:1884184-Rhodomonas_salina.1
MPLLAARCTTLRVPSHLRSKSKGPGNASRSLMAISSWPRSTANTTGCIALEHSKSTKPCPIRQPRLCLARTTSH